MTIDAGLKPEGVPERSPIAGAGAPSGFSPASIVMSKPPVAVQLPQPDVSANRDAPHGNVAVEPQTTEPAIGQIEVDLVA